MSLLKPPAQAIRHRRILTLTLTGLLMLLRPMMALPAPCEVRSPLGVVPVVELYTSEGCSSCPPADRWLSGLRGASPVVLSFHVDYWDRLGWKDRFAQSRFSQRQAQQLVVNGAHTPYTPQVVLNGKDHPTWYRSSARQQLEKYPASTASVSVHLRREGEQYLATVLGLAGVPARLSAYWAVTEGPYQTAVAAGENRGETLLHDFVVREWVPVPEWAASAQESLTWTLTPATRPLEGAISRQVNWVVTDAQTGRPVQAIKLGC